LLTEKNRFRGLGLVAILVLAVALFAPYPAWAQEDPPEEPSGEESPAQEETAAEDEPVAAEKPEPAEDILAITDKDIETMGMDDLKALIDVFREELVKQDKLLAEIPGPQYREKRMIIDRRIGLVQEKLARINREIRTREEEAYNRRIGEIRSKYEDRIVELEGKKAEERDRTIARFEQILTENPDSELAPDVLFRLAQLYFDKANDEYLLKMKTYEDQTEELIQQGVDIIPIEPTKDYSRPIYIYRRIIQRYPYFHHMDGTYYLLGYCLMEQGELEEANAIYQKLIDTQPDSRFVPEAYVRIGEYYFDMDDFDKAIEMYNRVLEYKSSTFYDKALYKLGWSYYKINEFDRAVEYFTKVVDFYEERARQTTRGDDLKRESITYIAICFADPEQYEFGGGDQAALNYFNRVGEKPWRVDVIAAIGDVYFERASYEGARQAYRKLMEIEPYDSRNPEITKKIIESYEKEQEFEQSIAEGERLARMFGPDSEWRRRNLDDYRAVKTANDLIESALYASATFHHEQAQQTASRESRLGQYAAAIVSYRSYLSIFSEAKNAYKARFNLAESLYFSERFSEAAEVYRELLAFKEGKYYKDAAFSLIKSYDKLLAIEGGLPGKKEGVQPSGREGMQPVRPAVMEKPLTQTAGNLAEACILFTELFPDDERIPDFIFKAGEIYYYFGHYAEARDVFDRLVKEYPSAPATKIAVNFILESYKAEEKYAELEEFSKQIIDITPLVSMPGEKKQLESLIQDAAFVSARKKQDKGEYEGAVSEYLRAATEHPELENAPKALHNAAVIYERNLNNIYKANELYIQVATRYPKWEKSSEDLFHAAYNYEKVMEIELAMSLYDRFANMFPDTREAQNALYNAGLLYEKNKEYDKAVEVYRKFIQRHPNSPDTPKLTINIGRLHREQEDAKSEEDVLTAYVKKYRDAENLTEAYLRLGRILASRGEKAEARNRYAQSVAIYKKTQADGLSIDARYAAEAKFRHIEADFDKYMAIKFELPQRRMAKQLESKAKMWQELRQDYQEVIAMGNFDWASAALFRIGLICKNFAQALFSAPVPEDLTPEEQDIYIVKLEDMAFPIESKAIEAFEKNVEKATEARYRNEWIDKTYDELSSYKPDLVETKFERAVAGESEILFDFPEIATIAE